MFLKQQNSLRDAIVAALHLNIFARHADRVRMANIAQMINVLQAMILTDQEKILLTPTYQRLQDVPAISERSTASDFARSRRVSTG
jgi:alpha-L-arabinofuranosidase